MPAYSAKKRWTIMGGALGLAFAGMVLMFWLRHHDIDPVSVSLVQIPVALIVCGLAAWSYSYLDEVQRQLVQKRWFWGSLIGFAAMLPLVVFLQTHKLWLDAAVQFIFHRSAMPTPSLYFSLGMLIPVMFQAGFALLLRLMDKLSQGSQS